MPPSALQKRREQRTILSPQNFFSTAVTIDHTTENDTSDDDHGSSSSSSPSFEFEASLHQLPRTLHGEIELVFPDIASQAKREKKEMMKEGEGKGTSTGREYLVIPTFHIAEFSILERNDQTEDERLQIFLRHRDFATEFMKLLKEKDHDSQLDMPDIDGSSTFSIGGHTLTVFDEVASTRSILGYSTFLYMGVEIVHHPRIGYQKLSIHTIVMYARPKDAEETYYELLKQYRRNQ